MKNNIFNTTKILLIAAAGVLSAACTKNFEDYNKKPYRPTTLSAPQLLTPLMREIIQTQENDSQMGDQMIGMEYGGHTAANTSWGTAGNFATYNPRQKWIGSFFGTSFAKVYGNWSDIRKSTDGTGPIYQMAQIIRVGSMLKVADTHGPIPYSKVNGLDVAVAYDTVEDLYLAMIEDLTVAADEIMSYLAIGNAELIKSNDVSSYKGDMEKWVRYANSLRLRMAIRMSKTNQAAKAQEVAEAAINHIGGVIDNNGDNLYITPAGKNPYFVTGVEYNGGELRINASLTSYMNGYNDPRRPQYFTAVNGKYVGLRSGMEDFIPTKYNDVTSFLNLKQGDITPVLVMCAAEVAFLKAEGALMGWNMRKDVKTLYEEGIALSFNQHSADDLSTYLTSTSAPAGHVDALNSSLSAQPLSTITVKWDDSATAEQKLERLIVQKWIAIFPLGFESWADIRRTGYPKIYPTVSNLNSEGVSSTRGMRRVPFSRDEFDTNAANVQAAIGLLGGPDTGATDLWWAKKN